jgi:hypothetical protein
MSSFTDECMQRMDELRRRVSAGEDEAAVRAALGFPAASSAPTPEPPPSSSLSERGAALLASQAQRDVDVRNVRALIAAGEVAGVPSEWAESLSADEVLAIAAAPQPETTSPELYARLEQEINAAADAAHARTGRENGSAVTRAGSENPL